MDRFFAGIVVATIPTDHALLIIFQRRLTAGLDRFAASSGGTERDHEDSWRVRDDVSIGLRNSRSYASR